MGGLPRNTHREVLEEVLGHSEHGVHARRVAPRHHRRGARRGVHFPRVAAPQLLHGRGGQRVVLVLVLAMFVRAWPEGHRRELLGNHVHIGAAALAASVRMEGEKTAGRLRVMCECMFAFNRLRAARCILPRRREG